MPADGLEEFQRGRLLDKAESIALDLERQARYVRQHAEDFKRLDAERGPRTYGVVSGRIQHSILWGVANLGLEALTDLATDADATRLETRFSLKPLSPREPSA